MGYDYASVHVCYTIPPAVVLSLIYRPLLTSVDVYKILFLITIAVVSTIPWDSYLIRNNVWSYPPDAIVGPTLFDIPTEELFFFVIQTYNTTLLYLLLNKPTFHPAYLRTGREGLALRRWCYFGACTIAALMAWGWKLVVEREEGFYMGLILIWATPFILLLWVLAHQLLIELPVSNTVWPVLVPTVYLWVVDTIALKRGTWVIESETKLGWQLWDGLEVEEAFFFFATNCLIVFGLVAFDNALAILYSFPSLFPVLQPMPSPWQLITALLTPMETFDKDRIVGFREALSRLRRKSRSFYLASGVFQGRLRIDLILLYSFCRVADDLIDDAQDAGEAHKWLKELRHYLDLSYGSQKLGNLKRNEAHVEEHVSLMFPAETQSALRLLPVAYISPQPLYDLLKGFEMDLDFLVGERAKSEPWPIVDERTLEIYGERVAGTVAECIIELAFHHSPDHHVSSEVRDKALAAGCAMGVALQLVNIARDIAVDAKINRLYIPDSWIREIGGLSPDIILQNAPNWTENVQTKIDILRQQLLDKAFAMYEGARPCIGDLPPQARPPMRVAVESYMEIGRVLREQGEGRRVDMKRGRATVPRWRRIKVAWRALLR